MRRIYILCFAISVFLLPLLFGCTAYEAQPASSDKIYKTADSHIKLETTGNVITDVSQPDGDGYYMFDYNGIQRKYMLYIPEGAGGNAPLVFLLHGFAGTSKGIMEYTGMNDAAKKYGFAVVYPQGISWGNMNGACWNSGLSKSVNDDTGFLAELAEYLQQTYGFNRSATFAAGLSDGAYMMYRLACEAPDTFRAVASVAGSMSVMTWKERPESSSVGILQINGTKDNAAPIRDPEQKGAGFGGSPDIIEVIEYWKNADNLKELQQVRLSGSATVYEYSGSQNDTLVWYVEIEGFGHDWPKQDTAGFSASEVIIEFFSRYVK